MKILAIGPIQLAISSFEDLIFTIITLGIVYIIVKIYYYFLTINTVPSILDRYAISQELYTEKNLEEHKSFKEYYPIKFKKQYWYVPPEPHVKSQVWGGRFETEFLSGSGRRAFNYLNRLRYPLNYPPF